MARLCGEGAWNEAGWNAHADAHNLPISTLTAGLTPQVEYQGTVNATANASASGSAPFIGEARADLVDAAIRHKLASGRTDVISFGSGFVTLKAEPDQHECRAAARCRRARPDRRAHARRSQSAADCTNWPMRGQLQMATGELGFITLYAPDIDRASGHFDANLSFEGTLGQPRASGVIKLSGAELDFYQLNLALRALEVEARIVSNNLEFSSNAKAGNGTLASSGKIEWRDGQPYGDIRLDGENLRLVDVPEARIDASPDLDFRIAGHDIFVKGEVKLPLARIQPADLTNAVLPSADEVLVGPTEQVEKDPFRVTSEITMTLGEKVTIDTYGLSGHVTGSITERTLPDEPTRATGELQVKDGQYTALARKLDIERGRLIFSGGLLDDPAVDIRAVKEFPDVKAGVNVRGTLREPRLTFFSEPSVPQSQIVSLILAGGSLETAQIHRPRRHAQARSRKSPARPRRCWPRSSATRSAFPTSASNPTSTVSMIADRHFAGARQIPVAAAVRELRHLADRIDQHHQDALHAQRSLDGQDRGRQGAQRRPGVHHREMSTLGVVRRRVGG